MIRRSFSLGRGGGEPTDEGRDAGRCPTIAPDFGPVTLIRPFGGTFSHGEKEDSLGSHAIQVNSGDYSAASVGFVRGGLPARARLALPCTWADRMNSRSTALIRFW